MGALLAAAGGIAGAAPAGEAYFQFDSAQLDAEAMADLDLAADRAIGEAGGQVVITAHCDEVGAAPYNVALAIRRAEAARDYLISKGVDQERIVLAFYGEDGPRRGTNAEDRRVTVALSREPLHELVDRTLAVAPAMTWEQPRTLAEIEGPAAEDAEAVAER